MTEEVVVDTDVFSRVVLLSRPSSEYERFVPLLQGVRLVLAAQTVGELLFGARSRGWGTTRLEQLDDLIGRCVVVPVDRTLTEVWADLSVACRKQGHGLQGKQHVADRWIAATSVHLGVPLASNDSIFVDAPLVDLLRPE